MIEKVIHENGLAGKAVVVSGGTTGIGRATALLLATKGAKVLVFGRHEKELRDALHDLKRAGEACGIVADQARHEDVLKVFATADEVFGGLDILINNAAIAAESILQTDHEQILYAIKSNLVGCLACSKEAVARMKKRGGGHIINIGSLSADLRESGEDLYVATKSALQGFTEALRKSVNQDGIKVTLIEPGLVGTDMIEVPVEQQRSQQEKLEMLQAEDIARAVHYCLTQPRRCEVITMQVRPHRQSEI
jgi:NADP-dependent 3-hydroxy acid dehydrogenase YdfG